MPTQTPDTSNDGIDSLAHAACHLSGAFLVLAGDLNRQFAKSNRKNENAKMSCKAIAVMLAPFAFMSKISFSLEIVCVFF